MKQVQSFQADSGATYDNAADACKDDLRVMMGVAAKNAPIGAEVAAWIAANLDTVKAAIDALHNVTPRAEPELPGIGGVMPWKGLEPVRGDLIHGYGGSSLRRDASGKLDYAG